MHQILWYMTKNILGYFPFMATLLPGVQENLFFNSATGVHSLKCYFCSINSDTSEVLGSPRPADTYGIHRATVTQIFFMGKKGIHLAYEDKKLLLVQLISQQSNHRIVFHLDLTVKEKKNKKWNDYYYTSSLNNTVKIGIYVHTHTSWFLPLFPHIMLLPLSLILMVLAGKRRGWGLLEQIVVWIPSLQRIWCCFSLTIWSLRVIFICLLTHFCTFPLH